MARLSCGVQCTRTVLFALNLLFLLFGFTLTGLGIYVKVDKQFAAFLAAHTSTAVIGVEALQWVAAILIVAGVCTVLLSSFGCWGAVCQNRCFLYIYAVILGLLIIIELVGFVVALTFRNKILTGYDSTLTEIFVHGYGNNQTDVIAAFETLERQFKCCGVHGSYDYARYRYKIPLSCHQKQSSSLPIFNQGCADAIIRWVWDELPLIGGVLGTVFLIEIFGVIAAIALGVAISHSSNFDIYQKF
jgi:hypothetical protein